MATRSKVFMSGNSQAVRLPREFRLDTEDVVIERQGDNILIIPVGKAKEPWAELKAFWAENEGLDLFPDGPEVLEFDERPELDELFR